MTQDKQKDVPLRSFLKRHTVLIAFHIALIPPLLFFGIPVLQNWTREGNFGLGIIFLLPFIVALATLLFIDGIKLLFMVVASKSKGLITRTLLGVCGAVLMVPLLFCASEVVHFLLTTQRAKTIISNTDAEQLVLKCKVETIARYYEAPNTRLYLKSNQLSPRERGSHLGYRSFDPAYYDELFAISQSDEVKNICGYTKSYDVKRAERPPSHEWTNLEKVNELLETCSIGGIRLSYPLENGPVQASGKPTGLYLVTYHTVHNTSSGLFFIDISPKLKETILSKARQKKPFCVYNLPHIIDEKGKELD